MQTADPLRPVHPGEVLREEFLQPLGLSPYAVAAALRVPRTRIERLAREEAPVSPDSALRLARYFGTTPNFWLGLQARYDLEVAGQQLADVLTEIEPLAGAAEPHAASSPR